MDLDVMTNPPSDAAGFLYKWEYTSLSASLLLNGLIFFSGQNRILSTVIWMLKCAVVRGHVSKTWPLTCDQNWSVLFWDWGSEEPGHPSHKVSIILDAWSGGLQDARATRWKEQIPKSHQETVTWVREKVLLC